MDDERDRVRTPWAWLSGFAWFLLAWPLLSLLALDQLDLAEWDSIGLLVVYIVGKGLVRGLPLQLRRFGVARRLARDPGALLGWSARRHGDAKTGIRHDVALRLRDGRKVSFDADGEAPPLVRWLEQHAAAQRIAVTS